MGAADPELLEYSMFLNVMEITHGAYTFKQLRQIKKHGGPEWRGIQKGLAAAEARLLSRDQQKPE